MLKVGPVETGNMHQMHMDDLFCGHEMHVCVHVAVMDDGAVTANSFGVEAGVMMVLFNQSENSFLS